MSTLLLRRDPGPDKRMKMTETNSAVSQDRWGATGPAAARSDPRRRAWIPGIAALLCFLVGSDFAPRDSWSLPPFAEYLP